MREEEEMYAVTQPVMSCH